MGVIDTIAQRFGYVRQHAMSPPHYRPQAQRTFSASISDRLTTDWKTTTVSADDQLHTGLLALRARSRDLRDNNEYGRKYMTMLKSNVVGNNGIHYKAKAKDPDLVVNNELIPGKHDKFANKTLEAAWKDQGKPANCTTAGQLSWRDVKKMVIETVATDGGCLVRRWPGFSGSGTRYALQVLEMDYLDHNLNKKLDNGNVVRMGVEMNSFRRPVAYHLLTTNPNASYTYSRPRKHEVVPAHLIYHVHIKGRPEATLGAPWMTAGMLKMNMLDGYADAEITAARVAAQKMGFFETTGDTEYKGEEAAGGGVYMEGKPGSFEQIPQGMKLSSWDPQHPNSQYGAFMKTCLRGVAAAMGVSYQNLAGDFESVNFSSGRLGVVDEREMWKSLQCWFIEHFVEPVFLDWLEFQLATGGIPLPAAKFDKFKQAEWRGRRWSYIEPLKDVQAAQLRMSLNMTSLTQELAEVDARDRDEVLDQIEEDKAALAKRGLSSGQVMEALTETASSGGSSNQESEEDEDEDQSEND